MRLKRLYIKFLSWLPVMSLACGTFIFNTSEFIPIGLLSSIATDFAMSEANTGIMITIYAWVVALASLPLMLCFSQTELKKLMLGVFMLFVASHLLSVFSQSFISLVASRIGVALSHALFWSIVTPMAVRAAPRGKRFIALSIVITGSSLAMIAGLPLGRVIGLYLHWRTSFACIGAVAFVVAMLFWRVFPRMPNSQDIGLKTLPKLLKNKPFRKICILTALFVTGHFTAYSFIEPFLAQNSFDDNTITYILVLFGLSGVGASVLFSKFYDNHHLAFVNFALFGVVFALFAFEFCSFWLGAFIILCVFWGLSMTSFNLIFQSQVLNAVPQATAIAMSIYSGIYNVGIGGGAFVGAFVIEHLSVHFIGYAGAFIALCACFYFIRKMTFMRLAKRHFKRRVFAKR